MKHTEMKVIWFNTSIDSYQFGSYSQFQKELEAKPDKIIGLEKINNSSEEILNKIVTELNKCRVLSRA